jgi:hypothetical protein
VFIAACSEDAEFADQLAHDLGAALGSDAVTLIGQEEPLDDAARAAVEAMVRERDAFVVVLSPAAMASSWINHLVDVAWAKRNSAAGKLIVPLLLHPCEVRDDLDTLQRVSFVPPRAYVTALNALLMDLRASAASGSRQPHLADTATAVPSGALVSRPSARRARIRAAIPGIALVALSVSVLAVAHMRAGTLGQVAHRGPTATPTSAPLVIQPAGPVMSWPVPGPCHDNTDWTFNGQPGRVTYTCLSDSVLLKSYMPPSAQDASGGIVFAWSGSGSPAMFKMSLHVASLTSGACMEAWIYFGDSTLSQYYLIFVCRDGTWEVQHSDIDETSYMLGKGTVSPRSDFDLTISFESPQIVFAIGSTFQTIMTDPIPPPTSALSGIQLSIDPAPGKTGSVRLSTFRFTPLTEAAYG